MGIPGLDQECTLVAMVPPMETKRWELGGEQVKRLLYPYHFQPETTIEVVHRVRKTHPSTHNCLSAAILVYQNPLEGR